MNGNIRRHRGIWAGAVAITGVALLPIPAAGVVSSNTGININSFLGADTFYNQGYTGSRVIAAQVNAGHIWNGHEALTHVTTLIDDPATPPPNGDFDRAATLFGLVFGGRRGGNNPGEWQRGIAHGAQVWSGSLASSWSGPAYSGSWNLTLGSVTYPYYMSMIGGVEGQTADVVYSTWAITSITNNSHRQGRRLDAMANQTGKTVVLIAGATGNTSTPQVLGPSANFNSITAAGLQSDTTSPPYGSRDSLSSYGPNDFWDPITDSFVRGVVSTVDLAAPGSNIRTAFYGGVTGGNAGGVFQPGNNLYSTARATESPLIAGGAALLIDVGKDRFGGGASIDGRVIKAVLQNSATKTTGWDNGQRLVEGVVGTTQSLDYQVGAGRMNLAKAFGQYTGGTADVPGPDGGNVRPIGWDFGQVSAGAPSDYVFMGPLRANTVLTTTLNWFMDVSYEYGPDIVVDQSLDNLDLEVWKITPGSQGPHVLVAQSNSTYNNVEHLSFELPETANYMLRVRWNGEVFDRANDENRELFGLAWAGTAALLGDADGNGVVDDEDFTRLWNSFDKPGGFSEGDFNLNGTVDFGDFQILERNWGITSAGTIDPNVGAMPAVPEPVAIGPVMVMGMMLLRPRRRGITSDDR